MAKKDKKTTKPPTPSESEDESVSEQVENDEANPEDTSDLSDEVEEVKKPIKKSSGGKPEEVQVFVSGIPYECSEQEFKEFFGDLAKGIKEIKMPRYQDSGRCIGYAHITMSSLEGTQKVLEMSGQKLKGRYLDIKEAEGKNNAQFSKDSTSKLIKN